MYTHTHTYKNNIISKTVWEYVNTNELIIALRTRGTPYCQKSLTGKFGHLRIEIETGRMICRFRFMNENKKLMESSDSARVVWDL